MLRASSEPHSTLKRERWQSPLTEQEKIFKFMPKAACIQPELLPKRDVHLREHLKMTDAR